jgi:hypothetical protein
MSFELYYLRILPHPAFEVINRIYNCIYNCNAEGFRILKLSK